MGYDWKFKMAAMPIYGKNHSNDFFPRTTRLIRLIFCWKYMGHLAIYNRYNRFGRIINKPRLGGVKLGKMTQNFRYMNLLS